MDNIIPFPKHFDNFKEVSELIAQVCKEAGLSVQCSENVTQEYQQYYIQLFDNQKIKPIELPDELGLTEQQTEKLMALYNKSSQATYQHHNEQINHACHIIIALLIREQLR
ncbi:MAG: hypothetical protein V7782_16145 [Psychromonas sp.]